MPRKSWRDAIAAYSSPATLVLLLLGFAAGLPYMLVFSTLSVWLREAGVARETIGFASLIGLAYAFKWVWAPMLDQWRLPLLGRMGRRRSWLVLSQVLIATGLAGMALCDPQTHLTWLIALAVLVAFSSATQDIAIDAYRLEIVDNSRQAALAASYMAGYRIAALLATAGALYFAEGFGSTVLSYQHLRRKGRPQCLASWEGASEGRDVSLEPVQGFHELDPGRSLVAKLRIGLVVSPAVGKSVVPGGRAFG